MEKLWQHNNRKTVGSEVNYWDCLQLMKSTELTEFTELTELTELTESTVAPLFLWFYTFFTGEGFHLTSNTWAV